MDKSKLQLLETAGTSEQADEHKSECQYPQHCSWRLFCPRRTFQWFVLPDELAVSSSCSPAAADTESWIYRSSPSVKRCWQPAPSVACTCSFRRRKICHVVTLWQRNRARTHTPALHRPRAGTGPFHPALHVPKGKPLRTQCRDV